MGSVDKHAEEAGSLAGVTYSLRIAEMTALVKGDALSVVYGLILAA